MEPPSPNYDDRQSFNHKLPTAFSTSHSTNYVAPSVNSIPNRAIPVTEENNGSAQHWLHRRSDQLHQLPARNRPSNRTRPATFVAQRARHMQPVLDEYAPATPRLNWSTKSPTPPGASTPPHDSKPSHFPAPPALATLVRAIQDKLSVTEAAEILKQHNGLSWVPTGVRSAFQKNLASFFQKNKSRAHLSHPTPPSPSKVRGKLPAVAPRSKPLGQSRNSLDLLQEGTRRRRLTAGSIRSSSWRRASIGQRRAPRRTGT